MKTRPEPFAQQREQRFVIDERTLVQKHERGVAYREHIRVGGARVDAARVLLPEHARALVEASQPGHRRAGGGLCLGLRRVSVLV